MFTYQYKFLRVNNHVYKIVIIILFCHRCLILLGCLHFEWWLYSCPAISRCPAKQVSCLILFQLWSGWSGGEGGGVEAGVMDIE